MEHVIGFVLTVAVAVIALLISGPPTPAEKFRHEVEAKYLM